MTITAKTQKGRKMSESQLARNALARLYTYGQAPHPSAEAAAKATLTAAKLRDAIRAALTCEYAPKVEDRADMARAILYGRAPRSDPGPARRTAHAHVAHLYTNGKSPSEGVARAAKQAHTAAKLRVAIYAALTDEHKPSADDRKVMADALSNGVLS